jgi:hydrogenase maturation protease
LKKTLVLGVGNPLMSDEGLGIEAVKILYDKYNFPKNVEVIDGGTQGLELLQHFDNVKNLIIIDTVYFSKRKPGDIIKISKEEIKYYLKTKMSVHDVGLEDIISALDLLGKLPENIVIIGMIPEKLDFSYGLSETVKANLNKIITAVINQIKEWEVGELNNVDECDTNFK